MPGEGVVITYIADKLAEKLIQDKATALFKGKVDLKQHLEKLIFDTVEAFNSIYNLKDQEGMYPFFKSQNFLEGMLKFQFYEDFSFDEIINECQSDPKILPASVSTFQAFISLFKSKVEADEFYKDLEIEQGFKKKIYDTHEVVVQVKEILQNKTDTLNIEGATLIDNLFIEKLKSTAVYSPISFYTAKQDDNCQWFGIVNDYDVKRKDYELILKKTLHSFDKPTFSKVALLLHGSGGSGKSTVLRRLAIELSQKTPFIIIWINDFELERFIDNALDSIKLNPENRYFIFLEDWYRNVDYDPYLGDRLLKKSQHLPNVRLIIGDRKIKGKKYLDHVMNTDNIFKLKEKENEGIINKIVEIMPIWKSSIDLIFAKKENYYSPLFFLLFIINGVNSDRFGSEGINTDIKNIAKRLARYDLKMIRSYDEGVAKALFYWSQIYKEYKIFITPKGFEEFAAKLSNTDSTKLQYSDWIDDDELINQLKLYLHVKGDENRKSLADVEFIQFNHDLLAEDIISEVMFPDWGIYDNSKRRELLEIFMSLSDKVTKSFYLGKILRLEQHLFKNKSILISYVDKLFFKEENYDYSYLNAVPQLNLPLEKIRRYIDILYQKKIYCTMLWLHYFSIAPKAEKNAAAKRIFEIDNLYPLPHHIIIAAFKQGGNDSEKEIVSKEILENKNLESLSPEIVVAAFRQKGNELQKEAAAKRILQNKHLDSLPHHIVVAAFRQNGNNSEKIIGAMQILESENLEVIQPEIVAASFRQSGNNSEKEAAAKRLLDSENLDFIPYHLVEAFKQKGNDSEKIASAKRILQCKDLNSLLPHILIAAFRQEGNKSEKEAAANHILKNKNLISLPPDTVIAAFHQEGNKSEKETAAKRILENENIESLPAQIVVASFKQRGNELEKKAAAKQVLENKNLISLPPDTVLAAFRQEGNELEKDAASSRIINMDLEDLNSSIIAVALRHFKNK